MINRRDFLKFSAAAALVASVPVGGHAFSGYGLNKPRLMRSFRSLDSESVFNSTSAYFDKISRFDEAFTDDILSTPSEFALIESCWRKTSSLMRYVGFGNFNVLNFDEALKYMNNVDSLKPFTKAELDYLEMLFARDASSYGFYGEKIFDSITDRVDSDKMVKVPGSGHYIYNLSVDTYKKITAEMNSLILTSGVRSVMKQMYLFLNKSVETKGNLSMASRSIAPVGYSYHGIGDFDVGIKGWGYRNFTDKFATTKEYDMLMKRGYMRIRYDRRNPYGVRFEPWHVKVV